MMQYLELNQKKWMHLKNASIFFSYVFCNLALCKFSV